MKWLFVLLFFLTSCGSVATAQSETDHEDYKRIILYPGNLSLVNDLRSAELQEGENRLTATGLPAYNLESSSLNLNIDAEVLSQHYRQQRNGMEQIFRNLEGEDIQLVSDTGQEIEGNLFSYRNGIAQIETEDEKWITVSNLHNYHLITDAGRVEHEELPSANWRVNADAPGTYEYNIRYLLRGLNWQPEYKLHVDEDEEQLDFLFTATIQNYINSDFKNSELVFMAGDIQLQPGREVPTQYDRAEDEVVLSGYAVGDVSREEAFEYFRYVLPGRHNIEKQEHHTFTLESSDGLEARKRYRDNLPGFGSQQTDTRHFNTGFVLQNTEEFGLGMLIPAGRISVYQEYNGGDQLLGQDQIRQKAVGEEVFAKTGRSSNVTWSQRQISIDQTPEQATTEEREITLNNRSDRDVEIELELRLGIRDRIEETDMEFEELTARSFLFTVPVPAESEVTHNLNLKREDRRR